MLVKVQHKYTGLKGYVTPQQWQSRKSQTVTVHLQNGHTRRLFKGTLKVLGHLY